MTRSVTVGSVNTIVAVALLGLLASPAQAVDKGLARREFRHAEALFELDDFVAALASYTAAYEAAPLPAFLFNIGQCHLELRQYERATYFFERFLATAPPPSEAALAQERLGLARAAFEKLEEQRAEQKVRFAREMARVEQEHRRAVAAQSARHQSLEIELHQMRTESGGWRPWAWGGLAAAIITVGGGLLWALKADAGTRTVLPAGDLGTIDGR